MIGPETFAVWNESGRFVGLYRSVPAGGVVRVCDGPTSPDGRIPAVISGWFGIAVPSAVFPFVWLSTGGDACARGGVAPCSCEGCTDRVAR